MGQHGRIVTQIAGFMGWKVRDTRWISSSGKELGPCAGYDVPNDAVLVLSMKRRWAPRCASCLAVAKSDSCHEHCKVRQWADLPWASHPAIIEYAPIRVKCRKCGVRAVELLAWADPKQRQTRRLQQVVALDACSMPLTHVSVKYAMSWHTVRRAELNAIQRWERTQPPELVVQVGVDEKWLGRRHKLKDKFITIVSNLQTGTPIWIGYGRGAGTLAIWLQSLTLEEKNAIELFSMDMHAPFRKAIRDDPALDHAAIVHDPFHIVKRAGEALSELRRETFFRATKTMRAIGRGTRWLVLKASERTTDDERATLRHLFSFNAKLARAYQVVDELRCALREQDVNDLASGVWHVLCRTRRRANVPMRKLHDSLKQHMDGIIAFGEHRPQTGRTEALNNNWETLVRRGRGYRNHQYLLTKLRFITANPVSSDDGAKRFLALGIPVPSNVKAAA